MPKKKRMEREIHIRMPKKQYEELVMMAGENYISPSAQARQLLAFELLKHKTERKLEV